MFHLKTDLSIITNFLRLRNGKKWKSTYLDSLRENEQLSKYGDTKSAKSIMLAELKKLIEANPLFCDKLNFPSLKNSRLRTLINQSFSLNWQHQLCKNPKPNPDHSCGPSQPNGAKALSPVTAPLMGAVPKAGGFPPLSAHGPFSSHFSQHQVLW
ncbi:unnamed protein product [Fraxinus pennsylvanica]|uniref:Uncharacterized protein n=1 Tax=Fraxinus pennsylvanica TaxID=56036 RepID=A0AAD2E0J5_9LAMI|nr:unnamed protein product [Fraxinus pennsylvanica]